VLCKAFLVRVVIAEHDLVHARRRQAVAVVGLRRRLLLLLLPLLLAWRAFLGREPVLLARAALLLAPKRGLATLLRRR